MTTVLYSALAIGSAETARMGRAANSCHASRRKTTSEAMGLLDIGGGIRSLVAAEVKPRVIMQWQSDIYFLWKGC
ncbi:hypothetical protein BDR03DRAFT_950377 [Suillus americanus]|nr:hypothetical protein BDR03DRAFT_950377 [Suillus americanus]